jgi:hypothetical protein
VGPFDVDLGLHFVLYEPYPELLDKDGNVVGSFEALGAFVEEPKSQSPAAVCLRFLVVQLPMSARAPFYKFDLLYHPNGVGPTCKLGECHRFPGGRGAAETHMTGLHADGRFEAYLNREDVHDGQMMGIVNELLAFCKRD